MQLEPIMSIMRANETAERWLSLQLTLVYQHNTACSSHPRQNATVCMTEEDLGLFQLSPHDRKARADLHFNMPYQKASSATGIN
jgi:hypothetical protein